MGPTDQLDAGDNYPPAIYLYYDLDWNLIQEGAQSTSPEQIYAYGAGVDELVTSFHSSLGYAYHHYDARKNAVLLTGPYGDILEQYAYDGFGKTYFYDGWGNETGWSPMKNRFLFTGRERLADLGVYDYRNRLYHPELGRFMQPDPKQFEAGDYNLYRYCHNDPVNHSDPFGLTTPELQYDDLNKKTVVEAQMKTLRAIPAFAEKFKEIDANNNRNIVKDAQSPDNSALKTPNGLKSNRTQDGTTMDAIRSLFSRSASKTVTSFYDPSNGQTQTGRERAPIFGLANEIGEMFLANGVVKSSGGNIGYDNESIRFENEARNALGAEPRPYNTDSIFH